MIPLPAAISSGFTWSRRSRTDYEVKLKGSVASTLRRLSLWSSNYEATTLDGTFRIQRKNWCGTKAEIVDAASQRQIASFESGWRRTSTLTFADGQRFHLERNGCWRALWNVTAENGEPVLLLQMRERTANAPIEANLQANRLSLIVLFILYRVQLAEEKGAAAATVGAVIAAIS